MKELIQKLKLSVREFSEMYNIPYKTVLQWRNGERKPPEYLVKLIEENIKLKTKGEQISIFDTRPITHPKYVYVIYDENNELKYRHFTDNPNTDFKEHGENWGKNIIETAKKGKIKRYRLMCEMPYFIKTT